MAKRKQQVRNQGKLSQATRRAIRPSQREDMPSSAFLVPSEKKYPVKKKNPQTGKWEYDPNLILAAERRAASQKDESVKSRAKALLQRVTGKK